MIAIIRDGEIQKPAFQIEGRLFLIIKIDSLQA